MQAAMVVLNIIVLLFVASAGSYAGFKNGWKGYEQPDGCVFLCQPKEFLFLPPYFVHTLHS